MMQGTFAAVQWLRLECRTWRIPGDGWGLLRACRAAVYASAASLCLSVVILVPRASCSHDAQPSWETVCGCHVITGHTAEQAPELFQVADNACLTTDCSQVVRLWQSVQV